MELWFGNVDVVDVIVWEPEEPREELIRMILSATVFGSVATPDIANRNTEISIERQGSIPKDFTPHTE